MLPAWDDTAIFLARIVALALMTAIIVLGLWTGAGTSRDLEDWQGPHI
jgi:hypothetical protein